MEGYIQEAESKNLKGRIICGAGSGYNSKRLFSLEEVFGFMDEINKLFEQNGILTIPCLIKEGYIVGRATTSNYRAKTYDFEFSWSPRIKTIKPSEFHKILQEYVSQLGKKMGQERVYLEFEGRTTVFLRENKKCNK